MPLTPGGPSAVNVAIQKAGFVYKLPFRKTQSGSWKKRCVPSPVPVPCPPSSPPSPVPRPSLPHPPPGKGERYALVSLRAPLLTH
jgi:hypothetical protein